MLAYDVDERLLVLTTVGLWEQQRTHGAKITMTTILVDIIADIVTST